ncbi:MAG: FAD-dependent oxidoreductase, partial [Nitrosomonas sp.]|nr:FAD-dependent oxidoreductase [Nitrosomonas sp.]
MSNKNFDTLIIGSGLAGFTLALHLAHTKKICIVTKQSVDAGASSWAQGGIAAALSTNDSPSKHVQDTLIAGAGLCDEAITQYIAENAPRAIHWLIDQGVHFTSDHSNETGYHLTKEGGHSMRRIIHSGDATGKAVQQVLIEKIRSHPNICVLEHHIAIDLITSDKLISHAASSHKQCFGAYVLDKQKDKVYTFTAQNTVLATGGASKVYLYTTNPDTATGDGIAMGWRAGCRIANMEFIQFHPTCLYH